MRLSTEQHAVIDSPAPHKRIIAVAGSGKSTVLVQQAGRWLRSGSDPMSTVAVSFTRRSGEVIRKRILAEYGQEIGYSGTSHGLAYLTLALACDGKYRLTPLTDSEVDAVVDHVAEVTKMTMKASAKVRKRARGEFPTMIDSGERALATAVVRYMEANRLVHVGQLVPRFASLLCGNSDLRDWFRLRMRTVLWDECQDMNDAEAMMLAHANPDRSFVVGDPNQGIYGFRGANPVHLWSREAETFPLSFNFRSGSRILSVANQVRAGEGVPLVAFRTDAGYVENVHTTDMGYEEKIWEAARAIEWAMDHGQIPMHVLCRTNHEVVLIDRALNGLEIRSQIASPAFDRFATPRWQRLFLAARYAMDPACEWLATAARKGGVPVPAEGLDWEAMLVGDLLSSYSLHDLEDMAHEPALNMTVPEFVSWYQRRDLQDQMPEDGQVDAIVMTAHASKGLEFKHVCLLDVGHHLGGERAKKPKQTQAENDRENREERNVLYVAVTRAEDSLVLCGASKFLAQLTKEIQ